MFDLCLCTRKHEHLFFQSSFSKGCIQKVKNRLSLQSQSYDVHGLIQWIQRSRGTKFIKQVWYVGIAAVIYVTSY